MDQKTLQLIIKNEDVVFLTHYLWGIRLTRTQARIVRIIAFQKSRRVSISAMTRYGKSFCVAVGIALLILLSTVARKIALIAPTGDQAEILRNYLAELVLSSPILSNMAHLTVTGWDRMKKESSRRRLTFKNGCEYRVFSAQGEAMRLMGFGADIVIKDEAVLIEPEAHTKIARMLGDSFDKSILIELYNPWHRNNIVYEHSIDLNWTRVRVDWRIALQEGRTSKEFIDERRRELTPIEFQVLYESDFPATATDALFDWAWIEKALHRKENFEGEVVAGLDVAEQGLDWTVLTVGVFDKEVHKYRVIAIDAWHKMDLMPTVAKLIPLIEKYGIKRITVDANGVGSGVYSRLLELRQEKKVGCNVIAYKGGLSPSMTRDRERFMNQKAESYWHTRKLFEENKISIINNRDLLKQLNAMKWDQTTSAKIRIIDPDDKSPDYSDSLNLMCWEGGKPGLIYQSINLRTPMSGVVLTK